MFRIFIRSSLKICFLAFIVFIAACAGPVTQKHVVKKPGGATSRSLGAPIYGRASWYGRDFQGKRTASGERFNVKAFTAAHRTLPFGTVLEVTNLTNNKKVRVRVNDRGPFINGRVLDLSYAAAKELGFIGAGFAEIKFQQVF